jgi:hypothetical protein
VRPSQNSLTEKAQIYNWFKTDTLELRRKFGSFATQDVSHPVSQNLKTLLHKAKGLFKLCLLVQIRPPKLRLSFKLETVAAKVRWKLTYKQADCVMRFWQKYRVDLLKKRGKLS